VKTEEKELVKYIAIILGRTSLNKVFWDYIMALLTACLAAGILKEYFGTYLEKKKKCWVSKVRWSIFIVWQICSILDIIRKPIYIVLLVRVLVVLLVAFNYEGHLYKKTLFTIIYNSVCMLIEFLVGYIFIAFGLNYASQELLGPLLSKILLLFLVKELKRFFCNGKIQELPHSYNMILIIIPLGSMFVVYTSFAMSVANPKLIHILWSFASLLIMLLINIIIFTIYLKLSENLELRKKNIVYKQEIDLYSMHIEEKEHSMQEFHKARHDLKNQLIYLLQLSENKNYIELEQFLENLIEKAPFDGLTIAKTDNSIVDALVNYKYTIVRRFGIDFTVKLEIPMQLPFDSADLCIILGNALDNALEANIRSKIGRRYIKLIMRMDINNLVIVVENSFDGHINRNKKGKMLTVKTDRINHGMGLDSIQKSVNKYHGIMKTSFTEWVFSLEILLYKE
jgi:two-component system, LytTR family, sensor histidine kinase AgrC